MPDRYTVEQANGLRAEMITLRDKALAQQDFKWSIILSHVISYMAQTIKEQEEARGLARSLRDDLYGAGYNTDEPDAVISQWSNSDD